MINNIFCCPHSLSHIFQDRRNSPFFRLEPVSFIGISFICIAALFWIVKKAKASSFSPSSTSQEAIQAHLRTIQAPDFHSLLYRKYEAVKKEYLTSISVLVSLNEQALKTLTILHLFKDSFIEEGCTPYISWKGCIEKSYDTLQISSSTWRHDCINNNQQHVDSVSFKRHLNELDNHQFQDLIKTCVSNIDTHLDESTYQVNTLLSSISISIFENYPSPPQTNISNEIYIIFKKEIYNEIKNNTNRISTLEEEDFSRKICIKVIKEMLSNAYLLTPNSFSLWGQKLDFTPKESICPYPEASFKWTSLFIPSPVSSSYLSEEPLVGDEFLELLRFSQKNPTQNIVLSRSFTPFLKWIIKTYYYPFCASFQSLLSHDQKPISQLPSKNSHFIENDREGQTYRTILEKEFIIQKEPAIFPGNCFLLAIDPLEEVDRAIYMQKIQSYREKISNHIQENFIFYINYVTVIENFSSLSQDERASLSVTHWAIAENSSQESLLQALENRCQLIRDQQELELKEPEYEAMAAILQCPVHIYHQTCSRFTINHNKINPVATYGADFKGVPRYLLDHDHHYLALTPRKVM